MTIFDLRGGTALITGSWQGIGFALARSLAEAGATIVLNGGGTGRLSAAADTLSGEGRSVASLAFDRPLNEAQVNDPEFSTWFEKRTPVGRWRKVGELVGACVFLSSAASSFVNGHTLFVDGGITACL